MYFNSKGTNRNRFNERDVQILCNEKCILGNLSQGNITEFSKGTGVELGLGVAAGISTITGPGDWQLGESSRIGIHTSQWFRK